MERSGEACGALLVLFGWMDYLPFEFANLTAFRLMRALKALRMLSHNEEMRLLIMTITQAMYQCLQVRGPAEVHVASARLPHTPPTPVPRPTSSCFGSSRPRPFGAVH